MRRIGNYAVGLDSTLDAIREIDYRRGLKGGAKMQTPKIDKLLAEGWDLTVTRRNDGQFHATVHLARRHGPDSHHCIRESLADVLTCLESYIDSPEQLRTK